ncbi:MAG: extracellular solute-binding protein [Lachnospiraceae bacterium]|nr:extracellular solute-binding protein [Lachnospiraceae bacterium]
MKNIKKFLALGLTGAMMLSMAGCGGSDTPAASTPTDSSVQASDSGSSDNSGSSNTPANSGETREINIGTWWVQYYDSSHSSVEDDPSFAGDDPAYMKFDNVKKIEDNYNVEFYWKNLTYAGVQESINNSILAGSPDCDIYLVELTFGIPAQLNGLALDLKTVLPEDHDLFTDQNYVNYVDLGDGKACIVKRTEAATFVEATYPLAFNKQMLEENNLEDPRELWDRGEWTWDKFIEYCKVLTQDTDGDGQIDQYGYCGFKNETFEQLMMSNGANVASGTEQTLTSSETGEALQMFYDMYNTHKVCFPYDFDSGDDSTTMRGQYREGNIGFWPSAAWIAADKADYDQNGEGKEMLSFDTVYVRWPVGPSGDAETNAGKLTAGEFYIIPAGVEDPETVVNVLFDMWNWYDGDTSIRDDEETLWWWYASTASDPELQQSNFDVMFDCGSNETFDLWNSLGVGYDFNGLIKGEVTASQFQETYKNQIQDALDIYFK